MDYVQINGILLYRDRWSRRILATGATPSGYFFFGGLKSPKLEASWCGTELSPKCLAFGRPSSEVDFATPEVEEHICLLVPVHLMLRYLGEETAMRVLPDARVLSCATACGTQLLKMMERILDKYLLWGRWWSSCSSVATRVTSPVLPEPHVIPSSAAQLRFARPQVHQSAFRISRPRAA
jgi:hypothetical protein